MKKKVRQKRRRLGGAEKVAILKRHLVDREEISKVCEECKVHPTQFYDWQKRFFENGVRAFDSDDGQVGKALSAKVTRLEEKLQRKDSVLSELMEEHIALKKSLGED
jgi:transposase-like protein